MDRGLLGLFPEAQGPRQPTLDARLLTFPGGGIILIFQVLNANLIN